MRHLYLEAEGTTDNKIISIGPYTKFVFIKGTIFHGYSIRLQFLVESHAEVEFLDSNFYEGSLENVREITFLKSNSNSRLNFKNCKFIHKGWVFRNNFAKMEFFGGVKMIDCIFLREKEDNSPILIRLVSHLNKCAIS